MRTSPLLFILLLTLALSACGGGREAPPADAPARSPDGPPRVLVLSSMIGYVEPCGCTVDLTLGGIDRAVSLVQAERAKGPTAVVVVGPTFFEHAEVAPHLAPQEAAKAKLLARALAHMDVAVWTPGATDRAHGDAAFEALKGQLGAPTGGTLRLGATQVGVISIEPGATPESVSQAAQGQRAAGATVVLALAPVPRLELRRLAKRVPEVDLWVLGDHPHEAVALSPAGGGYIVEAGDRGRNLGRLVLHEADAAGPLADPAGDAARAARALKLKIDMKRMTYSTSKDPTLLAQIKALTAERKAAEVPKATGKRVEYTLLPIEKATAQDPTVKGWIAEYNASLAELNLAVAGSVPPVPAGKSGFAGGAACVDCHEEAQAVWAATPHARAWQTLVDAGKTFDAECVSCHVAGWLAPGGSALGQTEKLQDVQCEACHGPGDKHVELGGDENWTKRLVPAAVCETCHNAHHSPKFDYDTYLPKILGPGHAARVD